MTIGLKIARRVVAMWIYGCYASLKKMTKNEFIESLEEIVSDKILITDEVDNLKEETSNNSWSISGSKEFISQLEIEDIRLFLEKIKINRNQQLNQSNCQIDLIYYSWFDEQACQLRFSLINSNHKKLPFNSKIIFVNNEDEIIDTFLNSEYHDGIPFEELQDGDIKDFQEAERLIIEINVYKELIEKGKRKHNNV